MQITFKPSLCMPSHTWRQLLCPLLTPATHLLFSSHPGWTSPVPQILTLLLRGCASPSVENPPMISIIFLTSLIAKGPGRELSSACLKGSGLQDAKCRTAGLPGQVRVIRVHRKLGLGGNFLERSTGNAELWLPKTTWKHCSWSGTLLNLAAPGGNEAF